MIAWAALGKSLLKGGVKKVATDKLLNRKKKTNKRRASVRKMMGMNGKQKEGGALAVRPTMDLISSPKNLDPPSDVGGDADIVIIKKQVIQVRDILKDSYTIKQEERLGRRKAKQTDKRRIREDKLEKPKVKPKESKVMKGPSLGLGIGNYFSWLAFGIILNKLMDLMPALRKIFGVLKPIAEFIGGVFNFTMGLVTGFIDKTYAGIEKLEKGIEAIGGKGAKELFEKFGKLFTQVINGALIAALIGARVGLFNPFRRRPKIKQPTRSFSNQVKRRRNLNRRLFDPRRAEKLRRVKNIRNLKVASKKIISPIVKRIPFIGALIDFALNYFVFKEPLGRSAFMAIGAGLAAWLGGIIGSVIPVGGTFVGAALGGWAGDKLAGALYDAIFASKETPDPFKDDKTDIKSVNTLSKGAGLDTHPSYAHGGMIVVENTTTYIQPIEV